MSLASNCRPWSLHENWLDTFETTYWSELFNEQISWEQPLIKVFGRQYKVPRLTVFIAEKNICYTYSNVSHIGRGWPAWFIPLLNKVNESAEIKFNGCLLNLYRNGEDRMGWHSDDEPEIDSFSPIASLSFGAQRDFLLKNKNQSSSIVEVLSLGDGDLLIMHPHCQHEWMHSVPIRKKVNSQRINLTFRRYI